jgi:hypothetical protein
MKSSVAALMAARRGVLVVVDLCRCRIRPGRHEAVEAEQVQLVGLGPIDDLVVNPLLVVARGAAELG